MVTEDPVQFGTPLTPPCSSPASPSFSHAKSRESDKKLPKRGIEPGSPDLSRCCAISSFGGIRPPSAAPPGPTTLGMVLKPFRDVPLSIGTCFKFVRLFV